MEILNQKLEQTSNCSNMKDDNNNSKAKNNKLVAVAGHIVAT